MNLELYAVALVVFAILFLQLSVFLLITILLTLAGMAIVLAIQVRFQRVRPPGPYASRGSDPAWADARAKSRRHQRNREAITFGFVAGTLALFYWLGRGSAQLIGPGLTFPSPGPASVPVAETSGLPASLAILAVVVGALWYLYAEAAAQTFKFRDRAIDSLSPGEVGRCQFDEALSYATTLSGPPVLWSSEKHDGDIRCFTLLAKRDYSPRRFALCRHHSNYLAMLDLGKKPVIARR